jgi:hypothetical protein
VPAPSYAGHVGTDESLARYESQHRHVFVWLPHLSISGQFEALVGNGTDDELVQDADEGRFLQALKEAEARRKQRGQQRHAARANAGTADG